MQAAERNIEDRRDDLQQPLPPTASGNDHARTAGRGVRVRSGQHRDTDALTVPDALQPRCAWSDRASNRGSIGVDHSQIRVLADPVLRHGVLLRSGRGALACQVHHLPNRKRRDGGVIPPWCASAHVPRFFDEVPATTKPSAMALLATTWHGMSLPRAGGLRPGTDYGDVTADKDASRIRRRKTLRVPPADTCCWPSRADPASARPASRWPRPAPRSRRRRWPGSRRSRRSPDPAPSAG